MIVWQNPLAFGLFLVLIGLIYGIYFWRPQKKSSLKFSTIGGLQGVPRGFKSKLIHVPVIIKWLSAAFIVLAIARPQLANVKIKKNIEGIDIMVSLDISDSMLIEDMLPVNRLESSKKTIAEFIKGRVSDRIGLVVFAGEAYTRVPLTLDYPLLLENLSQVTTARTIKMGTAIGMALANAANRLKNSTAKSKVIIFLTDGENNSGTIDPETALSLAKELGLKIYSIGMGKDGQAQLPVFIEDGMGNKIKQYRPMHSKVNDELLGKFAAETGGKYWRATKSNDLGDIFREINQLEKTEISSDQYTKYSEKYQKYLVWALVLLVISELLTQTFLRRRP
jgi:Ca-activated chloride channel family protein